MSTSHAPPPKADLNTSPALLLASLFAARRSGDALLARFYTRRLAGIGIHILDVPFAVAGVGATAPGALGSDGASAEVPT